jgi:hypothetical protein
MRCRAPCCCAAASVVLTLSGPVRGQELEPRSYSASPVGTHFVVLNATRLEGEVLTDPALPVKNVQSEIDVYLVGYARTFALAGRTASLGLVLPFARGDVSGDVFDAPRAVHRSGLGDARLRFALPLVGNPAMTAREFAQRSPGLVVGASLSVIAPTGQYVNTRLVNVGANRWAVKPELGFSYPWGNWFFEGSAGAWLYQDNRDFLGDQRRSQDPLYVVQAHGGYNFAPGLWFALNGGYYTGGRTTVDDIRNDDRQSNSRYGATLSVPFGTGWSAKLAWSKGFATQAGGDYKVLSATLQYRWLD